MSDYADQIQALRHQAYGLEHGPARVALLEEAVRLADTHGDADAGYRTRLWLIEAATFGGRPDVALVAFTWCLAQSDREPEKYPEFDLLWKYKWVAGNLTDFPQVSRAQIAAALDDMGRRFARFGSSLHAVHQKRRDAALEMGDPEAARAAHAKLTRTRRDWLSDCAACVLDADVDYHSSFGRNALAVRKAGPILAGRVRCGEIPHRTYARLLLPLARLGRLDEAMDCHLKGYRLIARNPEFIRQMAQHALFLALTDNLTRAVQLVEKHLPTVLATPDPGRQFDFFRAGLFVLDRLAERGKQTLKLRLPPAFPLSDAAGRYATADLARWFAEQAGALADRFDARNGNSRYRDRLAELAELRKLVTPHPLPARGAAAKAGE